MLTNLQIRVITAIQVLRMRKLVARGSVSISTIIWIVIAVLVAGGTLLWLTAGGGITAIKTLLTSITGFFNKSASIL